MALLLGSACSYLQTRFGFGVVGSRGDYVIGPDVFARSGLNFYALQHVTLVGAGKIHDELGNVVQVKASIALPITIWTVIPVLSLITGGYTAGRRMVDAGRSAVLSAGLACGCIYGIILCGAAAMIRGKLEFFLLPQIGGITSNPPPVEFSPRIVSALVCGCGFGTAFATVGALIATRRVRDEVYRVRWWACIKAASVVAIGVQILIALLMLGYLVFEDETASVSTPRIIEMVPAASGLGYSMIHGATLVGFVESRLRGGQMQRPFYAEASLYTGIKRGNEIRQMPTLVWVICLLLASATSVLIGWLAVRWGSVDGSLPAAFRCTLVHTFYIALLPYVCGMFLSQTDPISSTSVAITAYFKWVILASFGLLLVCAIVGASLSKRRSLLNGVGL
ncbi:MAG: hypothetical protein ACUVRS_00215 [Armatimonadota bacterium]